MSTNFNLSELEDRKNFYFDKRGVAMREKIKRKDNYECQWCKEKGKLTVDRNELNRNSRKKVTLIVRHIKKLEHHPDLRLDEVNLITICFECYERHHKRWKEKEKYKPNKWEHDKRW
jgi:5-methylcytosine-specific restriction endonuclease McrA